MERELARGTGVWKVCKDCFYRYKDNNPGGLCLACNRGGECFKRERNRGFEPVKADMKAYPTDISQVPLRGTKTSAGYDFFVAEDLIIYPQQKAIFKTDVKAYMQKDEVLLIVPRSSTGFKHNLMLLNGTGVIDSDFYGNAENDGNIGIGLFNYRPAIEVVGETTVLDIHGYRYAMPLLKNLKEENAVVLKKGDRIAQGIFVKYLEADGISSNTERTGGIGSSGK
ncbi:hypothetical protein [Clostridium felsineum]|uniref:hypothetical protein n=1 Tax=Clostridium felsineum TaxID=36839 RepID=UPI0009D4ADCC|nr:hypothetical protein [Clostridium felsineum]URZ16902.1 Deoxyuridine 5'-triphosphate nucleotidohydrolase [Clostridium felsineum DSM 794]